MMTKTNSAIEINNLEFSYSDKPVLKINSLSIMKEDSIFLYGPSGSGKTTLLNLLLGTHLPQRGSLNLLGHDFFALSSLERDQLRGELVGAIFQSFNLIPFLTVEENILLPIKINKKRASRIQNLNEEVELLLDHLKLKQIKHQPAKSLSIGQQQRVAAARSLIGSPEIIIADEPTSALDYDHKEAFVELLMKEKERTKSTLVFVSHDHSMKKLFSKEIHLPTLNEIKLTNEEWL
jgi:putative ABC transport system ATP-binding protein